MNNNILEKLGLNISNSWIIGCSILTGGIMTHTYLTCISNLAIMHMKHKYILELRQIKNTIDLSDKIKNEENIISYYWKHYSTIFMMGITGLSIITFRYSKK